MVEKVLAELLAHAYDTPTTCRASLIDFQLACVVVRPLRCRYFRISIVTDYSLPLKDYIARSVLSRFIPDAGITQSICSDECGSNLRGFSLKLRKACSRTESTEIR